MKRQQTFIVPFSNPITNKMKEKLQTYLCKLCNKEVHEKKVYLDGHCAKCKLLKLKMSYTENINKFEAHQQIKKLRKKEWEDTDADDFSDNISGSEDDKDPDFVASSVSPKVKRTLMLNKPKLSSHKRPVPFPKDVKKMPLVKQKWKGKSRKPLKGVRGRAERYRSREICI